MPSDPMDNPYFADFTVPAPETMYLILEKSLQPGDVGYDHGYRFLIEQVDGQRHYFKTRTGDHGSLRFCALHALLPTPAEDIERVRRRTSSG